MIADQIEASTWIAGSVVSSLEFARRMAGWPCLDAKSF
jgi:hypothetical protein